MSSSNQNNEQPNLRQTVINDFQRGDLKQNITRDWNDLKQFFLNEQNLQELNEMGVVKRWIYMVGWLFKSLILKLHPTRRILLLFSFIMLILPANFVINGHQFQYGGHFSIAGLLILIFILMLELKDKLVAKTELEAGRAVQIALMPELCPKLNGWELWLFSRPANDVGGDLIDYLQIEEERYSAALGDVAGKGLSAALLNAKLQSTLRAIVQDYNSLSDLASKINDIFYRDSLKKIFASFVYLEFAPKSGLVKFVNAGHLPPIVLKSNSIRSLDKGGPAFGLMNKIKYVENSVNLEDNDYFFLYSDGVTEDQNENGDFFSEQRLNSLLEKLYGLTALEFGNKIVSILDSFVGDRPPHDDISIIVLRRNSNLVNN